MKSTQRRTKYQKHEKNAMESNIRKRRQGNSIKVDPSEKLRDKFLLDAKNSSLCPYTEEPVGQSLTGAAIARATVLADAAAFAIAAATMAFEGGFGEPLLCRVKPPKVNHFFTCAELMAKLPHVAKMWETFKLFVRADGGRSIDILKVSDCLHAMGINFEEEKMKACLVQRMLRFKKTKPHTRVTFEFVLAIYCELAGKNDVPSSSVMINGLSCCDVSGSGVMPYEQLHRILTTVGERLNESEAHALLDTMKDDNGNVNYVALMEAMFTAESEAAEKLHQSRKYLAALGSGADFINMQRRDEFIRAVRMLDDRETGFVLAEDMLAVLNRTGESLSMLELGLLTTGMTNEKKMIDYRRFLRYIMNETE